jgi:uncharacterized protein YjdB
MALVAACGGGGGPDRPVAAVDVTAPTRHLAPGESIRLTALARDGNGEAVSGGPVAWSVSDPTVATISPTGRLQALAGGAVIATATIGEARGWR